MKKYLVVTVMIVCLNAMTTSNNPIRDFEVLRHNINNVELCISNYGKFGKDEGGNNPGCWWPIGSGQNYIFGAGIWFGAVDALTGDTLVSEGHYCMGGGSEFAPGLAGWPHDHPCAIIYMYPENWPAPPDTLPMAPQDLVSHEDSWCCFNDCDSIYHVPGEAGPIGIEVYQTVYAWDIPFLEDIIFITYDVKNVSGHLLNDCYIGICANCDIGNESGAAANDRYTGIVCREYMVGGDTIVVDNVTYQWQEVEEPGTPTWFPGVIGFDLLQTPFDLVAGMDKDGDGIPDEYERDSTYYVTNLPAWMWDVDHDGVPDWRDPSQWPQIGMSALKQFRLNFEPQTDPERYATMAGYNILAGVYEPYDTLIPDPDDQRFLISSGPFDLEPDSIVTVVFALMFADWMGIYVRPDTALALIDQYAEDYYNMYWYLHTGITENCEMRISNCEMRILPNPISSSGLISFSLPVATDISLKLYNTLGQLVETVYDGFKPAGIYDLTIDTGKLPQGLYFVLLETKDFNTSRSIVIQR
jgi:hypothetical protein